MCQIKHILAFIILILIVVMFAYAAHLDGIIYVKAFADYGVKIPEDAYGVFKVAETGTSSPLYFTHGVGQSIVDRENAACIRIWADDGYAIFDHQDSVVDGGIWRVNEMVVGGSAFLYREGKPTKEYLCTAIYLASSKDRYNLIADIDKRVIKTKSEGIICVSCAWKDGLYYVAYYKLVGEKQ